jgi:anti-sigma factor RsiW
MATCVEIQAQLSDYADGQLAPDARAAVRAHLAECADCSGVLADLQRLTATAHALGPVPPPEHVWLEVAGQIRLGEAGAGAQVATRRSHNALWQWIGLAAALVIITGVVYVMRGHPAAPAVADSTPAASTPVAPAPGSIDTVASELDQAQQHYERAIAELMAAASSPDSPVDPAVATTVRQNLTAIDAAITESRAALSVNPESDAAQKSLFEALRRKITVLQATVSLINQMRQGDQEGAARTAADLGKKS